METWKGKNLSAVIEPGMITSNEPGVYITGKYGIRLENMIVCKEREKMILDVLWNLKP